MANKKKKDINPETVNKIAEEAQKILKEGVTEERVREAKETFRKYKAGKKNLEARLIENEEWWKRNHWQFINNSSVDRTKPTSAWLVNAILTKHADAMDAFPEPNFLPREAGDKEEAERLSDIIPMILQQNDYKKVYSDNAYERIKSGTGCYGIFWDTKKLNGLGDISIKAIDILNLFWEPGITDIQDSRNLFYLTVVDDDLLEQRYPQLQGNLHGDAAEMAKYQYDDNVDTSNKSIVYDWYYKVENEEGQTILHYCKFVGETILYATENDTAFEVADDIAVDEMGEIVTGKTIKNLPASQKGWYDHGQYPFVMSPLFPSKGTPAGFGFIDICKNPQEYIDKINQALLENTLATATPRYFYRNENGINEEEFCDWSKPIVHVQGNLSDDNLKAIDGTPLTNVQLSMLSSKIDELKETSGNRDVNNGGTAKGVTAASAIAAMQEEGGKLSRDMNGSEYRSNSLVYYQIIELIRQFYDMPRQFRIVGRHGEEQFVDFDNSGLKMEPLENAMDPSSYRLPVFDIEVRPQAETPYNKLAYNELALQFYNAGFFNPQYATQAIMCLDMMEFKGKEDVIRKIQEQAERYAAIQEAQMRMQQAQMGMQQAQANMANATENIDEADPSKNSKASADIKETDETGAVKQQEHKLVRDARAATAERTKPR